MEARHADNALPQQTANLDAIDLDIFIVAWGPRSAQQVRFPTAGPAFVQQGIGQISSHSGRAGRKRAALAAPGYGEEEGMVIVLSVAGVLGQVCVGGGR